MRSAVQSHAVAETRDDVQGMAHETTGLVDGEPVLAPLYGVLGAAIAVAIATLFWLVGCAVALERLSGFRTDALYLLGRRAAFSSAPA